MKSPQFAASDAASKAPDHISRLPPELVTLAKRVHSAQSRALAAFEADASSLPLPRLAPDEEHRRGAPLLARKNFPIDVPRAHALLRSLQGALSRLGGEFREASQRFGALKSKGRISAGALFRAYLNGDDAWFAREGRAFAQAPALPRFLAQNSLTPFAHAVTRRIAGGGGHNPASIWTYGHCPHCGSLPAIGELHGAEGARRHVCSFCLFTYRAKRLQCPFCFEENPDQLAFFTADTEPGYQAHICRSCKSYIKLADSRHKGVADFVPASADLLSLPLDMLAAEEGFQRPTSSLWGF